MDYTDGTYRVWADGTLERVELAHGFMVGVRSLEGPEAASPLTLVGRWTDHKEGFDWKSGYEINENVIYWDEVELVDNLALAGKKARERGEIAIWDNYSQREIRV